MRIIWNGSNQVTKNRIMKKEASDTNFRLPFSFLEIAMKLLMTPINKETAPNNTIDSE